MASGDLVTALENMISYYKLSDVHKKWVTSTGRPMHLDACRELTRIYAAMAQNFQDDGNMTDSLEHYAKAFNTAGESKQGTVSFTNLSSTCSTLSVYNLKCRSS